MPATAIEEALRAWKGTWGDIYEPIPLDLIQPGPAPIKLTYDIQYSGPLVQIDDVRLADFNKGRRGSGVVSKLNPAPSAPNSAKNSSKKNLTTLSNSTKAESITASVGSRKSAPSPGGSNISLKSPIQTKTSRSIRSQTASPSSSSLYPLQIDYSSNNSAYWNRYSHYDEEENKPILSNRLTGGRRGGPLVAAIDVLKEKSHSDLRKMTGQPTYHYKTPISAYSNSESAHSGSHTPIIPGYSPLLSFEAKPTAYEFSRKPPQTSLNDKQGNRATSKKTGGPILDCVEGRAIPPLSRPIIDETEQTSNETFLMDEETYSDFQWNIRASSTIINQRRKSSCAVPKKRMVSFNSFFSSNPIRSKIFEMRRKQSYTQHRLRRTRAYEDLHAVNLNDEFSQITIHTTFIGAKIMQIHLVK